MFLQHYTNWWKHIISSIFWETVIHLTCPLNTQVLLLDSKFSWLIARVCCCRERELRPLVPDDYRVTIATQEEYNIPPSNSNLSIKCCICRYQSLKCLCFCSPILGVWRGGSLLASSPDFEAMCITKSEYEELGSARCRKRFFRWVKKPMEYERDIVHCTTIHLLLRSAFYTFIFSKNI